MTIPKAYWESEVPLEPLNDGILQLKNGVFTEFYFMEKSWAVRKLTINQNIWLLAPLFVVQQFLGFTKTHVCSIFTVCEPYAEVLSSLSEINTLC